MTLIISIYLFILGLMAGSFALALSDRMHAKKDWVKDRSRCDSCKKVLQPIDLVPILSWVAFRGKCRRCGVKLSLAYPLMELLTALWFLGSFLFWPTELVGTIAIAQFAIWLFALTIMSALFIYDLRWYLLPFKLVNPLIAHGVGYAALGLIIGEESLSHELIQLALAFVVTFGLFKFMHSASKGAWIGGGDVRLSMAIALFCGTLIAAWMSIFAASVIGLVIAVPSLMTPKNKNNSRRKLKVPFGPALLLGLYVAVVFGPRLSDWYEQLLIIG